jgi:hypothetical protein
VTGQQRMLTPPWHLVVPLLCQGSVLPHARLCMLFRRIVITFNKLLTSPIDIWNQLKYHRMLREQRFNRPRVNIIANSPTTRGSLQQMSLICCKLLHINPHPPPPPGLANGILTPLSTTCSFRICKQR